MLLINTDPTDSRFITSEMYQLREAILCSPETSPDRLFWQRSLHQLIYHSEAKLSCERSFSNLLAARQTLSQAERSQQSW